jgi:phosphoribosylanthranilate isomerase
MTRTRVKICGITSLRDAEWAVGFGADAIGFVFWPGSPRVVSIADARAIARHLPPFVTRVGVFVEAPVADVTRIAEEVGLDAVQLHGDEDVAGYERVSARLVKAATVESEEAVVRAAGLPSGVTVLADAADPIRRGGTGRTVNWVHAADLARRRPIILAGGLSGGNVAEAIRAVHPWAVDVASGVESAPGVKSLEKLERFFDAVRQSQTQGVV